MEKAAAVTLILTVLLILLRGKCAGVEVYGAFLSGAKKGMEAAWQLLPALTGMLLMLSLMNASGLTALLVRLLSPLTAILNLPQEVAPMLILRPMTGSGSLAALQEIFAQYGADSRVGRIASVLMGSSETIFYTMSVYLGAAGVKKLPGALGVSLGLGYAPECFYTTDELIEELRPLAGSDVVVTVHMRQEGDGVADALREMLTVARELRCPVEISHLKGIGRANWGRAVPEMLRLLENARAEGLDVACDVYPYSAGSTQLIHVLPPEFQKGGLDALTAALRDPTDRAAMRGRMETGSDFENITHLVGFENVVPISLHTEEYKPFEGKSLAEIADTLGKDPYDALFDLLAAERCEAGMIDFIAAEEDIEAILRAPFSVPISDATYPVEGLCHPRVYGSAARFLAHYVRERGILTLPQAVHKLTMQSADRLGLSRKGRIAVGADADLCLFSPENIRENGAYTAPRQLASGMDAVFVAGVPEIMDGQFTGETRGRVLRAH